MTRYLLVLLLLISAKGEEKCEQTYRDGATKFVPALTKQISQSEPGNFIVTPISLYLLLTLVQKGAKGPTAEQLRSKLFLPNDKQEIQCGSGALLNKLIPKNPNTLRLRNRIYVSTKFPIHKEFKDIYKLGSENIDFTKTDEAREEINKWVEKQTNDTIKDILKSNDLNSNTASALVNTVYLSAKWTIPFNAKDTKTEDFHKSSSKVVKVQMMHLENKRFKYLEVPDLKAKFLQLPLEEGLTINIGIPNDVDGVKELEKKILESFTGSPPFEETYVNVALPKFKVDFRIPLANTLTKLGITTIFDKKEVDLSGIAGKKGDVTVDKIVQKTSIELSEGGIEADASTSTDDSLTSCGNPKNFTVDRPFIFLVEIENVVVYIGRVIDPKY